MKSIKLIHIYADYIDFAIETFTIRTFNGIFYRYWVILRQTHKDFVMIYVIHSLSSTKELVNRKLRFEYKLQFRKLRFCYCIRC